MHLLFSVLIICKLKYNVSDDSWILVKQYFSLAISFVTCKKYYIIMQRILFTFTVVGYLLGADKPLYALALLGLIIPQVIFQVKHAITSSNINNNNVTAT